MLASVSYRARISYTSCGSDGIHNRLLSIFDRRCGNEAVPGLEVMTSIDSFLFDMESCLIRRSVVSDLDSTATCPKSSLGLERCPRTVSLGSESEKSIQDIAPKRKQWNKQRLSCAPPMHTSWSTRLPLAGRGKLGSIAIGSPVDNIPPFSVSRNLVDFSRFLFDAYGRSRS
jgi:hypothetical protein